MPRDVAAIAPSRHAPWTLVRVLVAALLCAGATAAAAAEIDHPANGIIVQLKGAPPHDPEEAGTPALPNTRAAAASAGNAADSTRRVLKAAGLVHSSIRPVGRAAHLIDFGHRLSGGEAADVAAKLRQRPEVEWVVPNERERRLDTPDDPLFTANAASSGQWWLFPVAGSDDNAPPDRRRGVPGVQSAWTLQTGDPAAVVAVLDTGITAHPDLEGHVLRGYDFVSDAHVANDGDGRDADPTDPGDWISTADQQMSSPVFRDCAVQNSSWHGTSIAGIVAAVANNSSGVAGINWDARVVPVRVAGKCGADVADIVDGMRWAAGLRVSGVPLNRHPARIVSVSFGGSAPCNPAYQTAIDDIARLKEAVVVAAAGNDRQGPTRPASCNGVIGVAALNRDGFKATYSNFGPHLTVATVGGDPVGEGRWGSIVGDDGVLTLTNSGTRAPASSGYGHVFGTSFAAPITAGVVSLMLSANPGLTTTEILRGLRLTARPHVMSTRIGVCSAENAGRCICTTATCGAGILDADQAVRYATDPASYVPPVWPTVTLDNAEIVWAAASGMDAQANETSQHSGTTPLPGEGGGGVDAISLLALAAAGWALRRRARPA